MSHLDDEINEAVASLQAKTRDWARMAAERADRERALADRMRSLSAKAASRGAMVTVTVNAAAQPTSLALTDEAMSLSPDELSALIMSTIRDAGAQVARRARDEVVAAWGQDDPLTAQTMSGYAEFLEPESQGRSPAPYQGGILSRKQEPTSW